MRNACLESIYQLAKLDPRVVFIGSDLRFDTLKKMKDEFPERFFMEGVSEQHIIGMAAGLAKEGFIPYVNTLATFITRRCYEQVMLDCGLHDLPVRLIGNGGGLVYSALGPTHLAIDDIALMRNIPNMTVVAPSDAEEMKRLMPQTLTWPHPMYIRIGRGGDPVVSKEGFGIGKGMKLREGEGKIISTGLTTDIAIQLAKKLYAKVLHFPTIKPFDKEFLLSEVGIYDKVIIIEEGIESGGLCSAVTECLADADRRCEVKRFAIPDAFCTKYGAWEELMAHYGITVDQIMAKL